MEEGRDRPGETKKKPYVKPEVRRVILRPEEAVLAACKTDAIAGQAQPRCTSPSNCHSIRS